MTVTSSWIIWHTKELVSLNRDIFLYHDRMEWSISSTYNLKHKCMYWLWETKKNRLNRSRVISYLNTKFQHKISIFVQKRAHAHANHLNIHSNNNVVMIICVMQKKRVFRRIVFGNCLNFDYPINNIVRSNHFRRA